MTTPPLLITARYAPDSIIEKTDRVVDGFTHNMPFPPVTCHSKRNLVYIQLISNCYGLIRDLNFHSIFQEKQCLMWKVDMLLSKKERRNLFKNCFI